MTDRPESHPAYSSLQYVDGVLLWGGRKVTEIARHVGGTPFYAYDRARISKRIQELRAELPGGIQIYYAVKANPMPELLAHVASLADGFDVASGGELDLAIAARAKEVSFAGPGKRDFELIAAINGAVTISLESEHEMQRVAALGRQLGKRPEVMVRVNPPFELRSFGMHMGGRPSPFGVDAERVPALLRDLRSLDLTFRGFHIYAGSQNLLANAIAESLTQSIDLIIELAATSSLDVPVINLGGGLGIPYFPDDEPLDLAELRTGITRALTRLEKALGNPQIILELGRYLVGEAGIYVCRVTDIKQSRGTRYAITDGGMHHHLAATGNLGQTIRRNFPLAAVENSAQKQEITVVGPLCTPLDVLGNRVEIHDIKIGSLITIFQSGAYGRTASPEKFLSHPKCAEILL